MHQIIHLTTVHSREDVRIVEKECTSLVNEGYQVHLVVGDGKGDDVYKGINVHDIGIRPSSRIKRMWYQPKKAQKKIFELNPDVVHFHDPELLPLGVKLAKKGIYTIYDAHEDVPRQNLTKHYIPKVLRPIIARLFEIYENYAVKKLRGVVAATPHIGARFSTQGNDVSNINNYPMLNELVSDSAKVNPSNRICYIGAISRVRGLLQVVQALPLVPNVRLDLCGKFNERDFEKELRDEAGWRQVDYHGQVDRLTSLKIMKEAYAGIVTFLPCPNHLDAQPNKLFEYMSARLPVIGSYFPLWRDIIEGAGAGICVNPEEPDQIACAIRYLNTEATMVEQMGLAGRQAVLEKYNWAKESKKLTEFYKAIL